MLARWVVGRTYQATHATPTAEVGVAEVGPATLLKSVAPRGWREIRMPVYLFLNLHPSQQP